MENEIVVWFLEYIENNSGLKQKLTKYLKRSCWLNFVQYFSLEYFLQDAVVREIKRKNNQAINATGLKV